MIYVDLSSRLHSDLQRNREVQQYQDCSIGNDVSIVCLFNTFMFLCVHLLGTANILV